MPDAAREQCLIQDRTPQAPDDHLCRGVCGGRLYGLCGEIEDPDSDKSIHRICQTCAIAKATATGSSSGGKSTSTGKRKADNMCGGENIGTSKKHASDSKSKSRIRLNFVQKIEILGLMREKITYGEIARRFKCGAIVITKIAKERVALEEDHALGGRDSASKSTGGGAFPKVCFSSTAAQQLEEQEEFATVLLQDSQDELMMARVNKMHVVEDPSDDELDDGETVGSTGGGVVAWGSMPPPSYAELSGGFCPLEHFGQSCGNDGTGNLLRRARMLSVVSLQK